MFHSVQLIFVAEKVQVYNYKVILVGGVNNYLIIIAMYNYSEWESNTWWCQCSTKSSAVAVTNMNCD